MIENADDVLVIIKLLSCWWAWSAKKTAVCAAVSSMVRSIIDCASVVVVNKRWLLPVAKIRAKSAGVRRRVLIAISPLKK